MLFKNAFTSSIKMYNNWLWMGLCNKLLCEHEIACSDNFYSLVFINHLNFTNFGYLEPVVDIKSVQRASLKKKSHFTWSLIEVSHMTLIWHKQSFCDAISFKIVMRVKFMELSAIVYHCGRAIFLKKLNYY